MVLISCGNYKNLTGFINFGGGVARFRRRHQCHVAFQTTQLSSTSPVFTHLIMRERVNPGRRFSRPEMTSVIPGMPTSREVG